MSPSMRCHILSPCTTLRWEWPQRQQMTHPPNNQSKAFWLTWLREGSPAWGKWICHSITLTRGRSRGGVGGSNSLLSRFFVKHWGIIWHSDNPVRLWMAITTLRYRTYRRVKWSKEILKVCVSIPPPPPLPKILHLPLLTTTPPPWTIQAADLGARKYEKTVRTSMHYTEWTGRSSALTRVPPLLDSAGSLLWRHYKKSILQGSQPSTTLHWMDSWMNQVVWVFSYASPFFLSALPHSPITYLPLTTIPINNIREGNIGIETVAKQRGGKDLQNQTPKGTIWNGSTTVMVLHLL